MDYCPPGSSGPWDFPGKNTGLPFSFWYKKAEGTCLSPGAASCWQGFLYLSFQPACYPCRKKVSGGSNGKVSVYSVGDPGSIPGLGRSPGEGHGNPLQYSCLENSMD